MDDLRRIPTHDIWPATPSSCGPRRVPPEEALRQRLLVAQAAKAISRLREAGIPCLALKGAAGLAAGWWRPGERPLTDVDILLPPDRLKEAVHILAARGWTPDFKVPAVLDAHRHSGAMISPHGFPLDLHWYALRHFRWPGVDDVLWERAAPVLLGGLEVLAPAPEDFLAHTIAHGARRDSPGAAWMADCCVLLGDGTLPWDWERFIQVAAHYRVGSLLAMALSQLEAVTIPGVILKRLRELPSKRADLLFLYLTTHYWQEPGIAQALVVALDFMRTRRPQGLNVFGEFLDYLEDRWDAGSRREVAATFVAQLRLWMARQGRRLRLLRRGA